MKKAIVVRERMDFGDPPLVHYKGEPKPKEPVKAWSIMHKVWDDGTEEFYFINEPHYTVKPPGSAGQLWNAVKEAGQFGIPVGENSEWGAGLPAPERDDTYRMEAGS